jgi:ribosome-associated protein
MVQPRNPPHPDPLPHAGEGANAAPPRAERASKTRRKQASHELQDLGEAVIALPEERLAALDIPETLLDAIRDYKRTKTFEGQRRQMQYIGKLMRRTDPEPIRQAVAELQLGRARDSLALHQAEGWRAALIKDDEALTRWAAEHPATDVQQLRSLVRNARKDAALTPEQRNGRAYRELFQFIKQHCQDEAT